MKNTQSLGAWAALALIWSGAANGEDLFFTAEVCGFCHSSGSGALVDESGKDVSIWHEWSGSMMANAFRDPLFQAKIASEVERNPQLESIIEDKCTRCHAPMGRTQWYHDGNRAYATEQAEESDLAGDGVSCALCHQIQPRERETKEGFSGAYVVEGRREIYGPFRDVFTGPMRNHLDLTPMYGAHIGESSLCGSCHVLFTPIVDETGARHGEFAEQATYLEWLNSAYAQGDAEQSCQACHAETASGAVKLTRRPPWYQVKREPFRRHTFNGGNRFVLGMLRSQAREEGQSTAETELTRAMERTKSRLREAATLAIVGARIDDVLSVKVVIDNRTGHKLPTGYPSRRMWLHLVVRDAQNKLVFESGGWGQAGDPQGLDAPYEPHHQVIDAPHQVQVYEAVMGDTSGDPTYTLLRAAKYLKDNRLAPVGFRHDGPWAEFTAVAGEAATDADFNREQEIEGTGRDRVEYRIPVREFTLPLRVEAELLYQTVSPDFARDVSAHDSEAARTFASLYRQTDKEPLSIARANPVIVGTQ